MIPSNNTSAIALLTCPVCRENLFAKERGCGCKNGHYFDFSADGYVNLMTANQKRHIDPGDNREMIKSRHEFLSLGHYHKLKDATANIILDKISQKEVGFLDIGCGEGYYTQGVVQKLIGCEKQICTVGIDISKHALRYAAKRFAAQTQPFAFAVGSAYHLPVRDASFDVATNLFSPLSIEEILRVLKPNGLFLYAVPGKKHLWELKEILYENPYENKEENIQYDGFSLEKVFCVEDQIHLHTNDEIKALFAMTPYYWKSPKDGSQRLLNQSALDVQISFRLFVFRKEF